jgi:uncharacterized membrane protein
MTTSEVSSNKPAALSNWLPIAFLILGTIGFADATYLTTQHFLGAPVACSILKGCEQVTTSPYSVIFGIPVALLGSIYYLTILILSVIYLDSRKINILNFIAKITPLGFLASLYFVYLQIFVIKAICLYCMGSAATSTILFILGMVYLYQSNLRLKASA